MQRILTLTAIVVFALAGHAEEIKVNNPCNFWNEPIYIPVEFSKNCDEVIKGKTLNEIEVELIPHCLKSHKGYKDHDFSRECPVPWLYPRCHGCTEKGSATPRKCVVIESKGRTNNGISCTPVHWHQAKNNARCIVIAAISRNGCEYSCGT